MLCELWAWQLVSDDLSACHFKRRPIVFKETRADLERLTIVAEQILDTCAVLSIFADYNPEINLEYARDSAKLRIDLETLRRQASEKASTISDDLEERASAMAATLLK